MESNQEISSSQTFGGESSNQSRPSLHQIYRSTGPGEDDYEIEHIYSPHPDYKLGPIPIEEREMTEEEIKQVLDNPVPPKSMDDIIKQGIAKGILTKYDLQVLHPHVWELFVKPPTFENEVPGREHLIGHPSNTRYFTKSFDTVWPRGAALTSEQKKERVNAEMTLKRCQQAMRYLNKHDDAAAYHEATSRILVNPHFGSDKAKEMARNWTQIRKLRFRNGRSHFTKVSKPDHLRTIRYENGYNVRDSTSSEEEEG